MIFKWGCLLFVFFLAILFYPMDTLEVRNEKDGRVIFSRKVYPGEGFEFSYIHSVDKTPVTGHFLITSKGMIKPIETQFLSYGPGLPSTEGKVIVEKGVMKARPEIEEMKRFSFFVSPFTNQCLIIKGERVDFSSMKEGERVTIGVTQYPIGRILLKHGG